MTIAITARVGKGGANHPDDVRKIQALLNAVPEDSGGPCPQLTVDGLCGRMMLDSILRFQSRPFFRRGLRLDRTRRTNPPKAQRICRRTRFATDRDQAKFGNGAGTPRTKTSSIYAMFDFSRTEESRPMRHGDAAWGWELS